MKKLVKLSLLTSVVLSQGLLGDTLKEAISNSKISGDVSVRYESRDFDREVSTYYQDTAYVVGTIGVNIETGFYNNFNVELGYRAYADIWEDDENSITVGGRGDANDRIRDVDGNDNISKAFLQYVNNGFEVQVGRKDLGWGNVDWLTKIHEGVFTSYTNGDLKLEALYTQRRGRVYVKELFPMSRVNNDEGIYHGAVTYTLNENYTAKAYALEAPDLYTAFGGKLFVKHTIGEVSLNSMLHYVQASEDTMAEDTDVTEITIGGGYNGYSLVLGYVQNDKDNGFGSLDNAGDAVVPFEEGDTMYEADATTFYAMLSKSIADVSLTALYGETEYGTNDYESSEFNIWAGYGITDDLSINLSYALTDEDSANSATYSDMNQVGLTLAYTF